MQTWGQTDRQTDVTHHPLGGGLGGGGDTQLGQRDAGGGGVVALGGHSDPAERFGGTWGAVTHGVVALGGHSDTGGRGDAVGWWHLRGGGRSHSRAVWGHLGGRAAPWGAGTCGAHWGGELGSISSGHAVRLLLRRLWGRRGADGDRRSCAVTPSPTAPPKRLTWAMLTPVSASTALGSFVTTPRISAGSRPTPMSPEPPATTVTLRVPSSGCATASATWPPKQRFYTPNPPHSADPKAVGVPPASFETPGATPSRSTDPKCPPSPS